MKSILVLFVLMAPSAAFAMSEICISAGAEKLVAWMKAEEPTSAPAVVFNEAGQVTAIVDKNSVWIDDGKDNEAYLTPVTEYGLSFELLDGGSAFEVPVSETKLANGSVSCEVGEPYFTQID